MIFKDYYKILELKTNKVTMEQVKIAYREQAKKYHPDVNVENKFAEERFKDINEAYRVLSSSSSKRKYDRMWNTHIGNKRKKEEYEESKRNQGSLFSDFFNMFFGGTEQEVDTDNTNQKNKKKTPIKGENIETSIKIPIVEAFYGMNKRISLRTVEGSMKTFNIKVPAGIRDNEKIRLIGQGKAGQNGGKSGDLFIKIEIEQDKKLQLKGYDLYTNLYLTPWEAALGTRVDVKGIDETSSVYIPEGIGSGEILRIPSKGYKDGKGGRGDLIAEVKIMVPQEMTDKEKNLYQELKQISKFNPRRNLT